MIRRAITEVDSWDGAASNFEDTDAYCKSCLINVSPSGENKQSHCMLPVKPPGSNAMADKAIFAAAGGRGITAVKKPSDVDQATWDKAVTKAAKTIVSAYKEMDREPPEGVMEMAGMEQRSTMQKLRSQVEKLGSKKDKRILLEMLDELELEEIEEPEERSLMFDQVAEQMYQWSYGEVGRPYFTTFFLEDEQLYGLFNQQGRLFRATVTVDEDGESLVVGELESVIHQFTPVSRSSFRIIRQADGQLRFFTIAATAIINRVGEIDSTKLFDDMIRRAEATGFYPTLDFYHLGDVDEAFEFGQFDFLAREGVVYIGSGLLESGHALSKAMERAIATEPEKWGASIEYYRPENRGIEYVPIGGGVEIAAYTEGLNTRISLLPESDAANWFTNVKTEKRAMNARQKKALQDLFGEDEEDFDTFMETIKGVNKEVRDKKLIHRSAKPPVVEDEAEAEDDATENTADTSTDIELDDDMMETIVTTATAKIETGVLATVTRNLETVTESLTKLLEGQTGLLAAFNGLAERVGALEEDEEEKKRTWVADLPNKAKVKVTHRPRKDAAEAEEKPLTYADKAAKVLDSLPKVGV